MHVEMLASFENGGLGRLKAVERGWIWFGFQVGWVQESKFESESGGDKEK
jgi:hypothetical protein